MSKHTSHWVTLGILSLALFSGESIAAKHCPRPCSLSVAPMGFYVGLFGGGGRLTNTNASQRGTAFYSESSDVGGPLAVDSNGHVDSNFRGFGGAHFGYAWKNMACVTPAIELEGFYFRNDVKGILDSPHTALPEHTFDNTFPMSTTVFLINSVFSFNAFPCIPLRPYVGAGIGGALLSVSGADSFQLNPVEPNVNHFSTESGASENVFAGQIKAGLTYALTNYCNLFAEYRFLYLGSSKFNFGSTVFPGHVPTAPWNVNIDGMHYNLGAVGIEFNI